MFNQQEIDEWIEVASTDSLESNDIVIMNLSNLGSKRDLIHFLVELKVQVDRWDLVTTDFVFHPLVEPYVIETLGSDLESVLRDVDSHSRGFQIWGTNIHFSPHLPVDSVLAIDIDNYKQHTIHAVALGKMDCSKIERLQNLKAFW